MGSDREQSRLCVVGDVEPVEILRASFVRQQFAPHMHETWAVGALEVGRSRMRWRREDVLLRPGGVMVIAPGDVHTGGPGGSDGWRYRMLYIPESVMADVGGERAPRFRTCFHEDEELWSRVMLLSRVLEESADPLRGHELLRDVLGRLVERHARAQPSDAGAARARARSPAWMSGTSRVRAYLHERFTERVTLHELAEVAGLSPHYLIRVFARAYGMPPYTYLEQLRVERARVLLREGMPASQVAYATGFADQSHLSRRFKRVVGVTPGRFARSHGVRLAR